MFKLDFDALMCELAADHTGPHYDSGCVDGAVAWEREGDHG